MYVHNVTFVLFLCPILLIKCRGMTTEEGSCPLGYGAVSIDE
jgi:hypothetical protein